MRQDAQHAVGLEAVDEAFAAGIAEGLGIRLVEGELTLYERELAQQLVKEKYDNREWNLRR